MGDSCKLIVPELILTWRLSDNGGAWKFLQYLNFNAFIIKLMKR